MNKLMCIIYIKYKYDQVKRQVTKKKRFSSTITTCCTVVECSSRANAFPGYRSVNHQDMRTYTLISHFIRHNSTIVCIAMRHFQILGTPLSIM